MFKDVLFGYVWAFHLVTELLVVLWEHLGSCGLKVLCIFLILVR